MIDLALWFMGYPDPVAVMGSTYDKIAVPIARRARKKYSVEDPACGMIKFDTGATLVVESSWALNQPGQDRIATTLCGDKGGLSYKHKAGGVGKQTCTQMSREICTRSGSMPEPFRRLPPFTISSTALSRNGRPWRPVITASRS